MSNNKIKTINRAELYDEEENNEKNTFGDRIADFVTDFSGTWKFVVYLSIFLIIWITGQVCLLSQAFDPYPFILLNLIISVICVIQTPIILIVQKRYDEKDRNRAKHTNSLVRKLNKDVEELIERKI